jgi:dCTP diphosphatase
MSDSLLKDLQQRMREFTQERDWDQFHTPKNLAMALTGEAAELQEIFQWLTPEQSAQLNAKQRAQVEEEVADVLLYLCRIADVLQIDLAASAYSKLKRNAEKYPAEQVRGSAAKYHEYRKE